MPDNGHLGVHHPLRQSTISSDSPSSRYSGSNDGQAEASSRAGSRADSVPRNSFGSSNAQGRIQDFTPSPGRTPDSKTRTSGSLRRRARDSGGFLLSSTLGRQKGSRKSKGGQASKGKEKSYRGLDFQGSNGTPVRDLSDSPRSNRQGTPDSVQSRRHFQSPPYERSGQLDGASVDKASGHGDEAMAMSGTHQGSSQIPTTSGLDPTQLVQMALSLNEGRRRHASTGLNTRSTKTDTRRIQSAGNAESRFKSTSPPERPSSQAVKSPVPTFSFSDAERNFNDSIGEIMEEDPETAPPEQSIDHQFTASTIARAQRARAFFELSNEYRRLLENLPPLYTSRNSSGITSVTIREYNPLQVLRNRKLRTRERRPLVPAPSAFEDITIVRNWVDDVEAYAPLAFDDLEGRSSSLPPFDSDDPARNISGPQSGRGHRRTDTAASRMEWTDSGWTFTPMELLADCIWSEAPENKPLLEDRKGRKIYKGSSGFSSDRPRTSEMPNSPSRTRTRSSTLGTSDTGDEDIALSKGKRMRKFLSIHRVEDDVRKRLALNRRHSFSSTDGSDVSDAELSHHTHEPNDVNDNIGPLAKHMRSVMEQEDKDLTPGLVSPERWDNLPTPREGRQLGIGGSDNNLAQAKPDHKLKPTPLDLRKSMSYSEGINQKYARGHDPSSAGDSTNNNSPQIRTAVPMLGMSLSPPLESTASSRAGSRFFDRHSIASSTERLPDTDTVDFAASVTSLIPMSSSVQAGNLIARRSLDEHQRPSLSRYSTNNSVDEKAYKDGTTQSSAHPGSHTRGMSRILKGGRLGDLVRTESTRIGDRLWRKDQDPESTRPYMTPGGFNEDVDTLDRQSSNNQFGDNVPNGGARADRPKYRIPLPSFRPTGGRSNDAENPADPITRQQTARRVQLQSGRQTKLSLPKLTVPGLERTKSGASSRTDDQVGDIASNDGRNGSFLSLPKRGRFSSNTGQSSLGQPGSLSRASKNSLPKTGLSNVDAVRNDAETYQARRHWSIADQSQRHNSHAQTVSIKDVARVRALFMSSGIKAHALCGRISGPCYPYPPFLQTAIDASGSEPGNISRAESFGTAARLWSSVIDKDLSTSQTKLDTFRKKTVPDIRASIDELRQKAAEQLTMKVHDATDEADSFTYDLNTHQTLAIKQVHDAIDDMVRHRRRNLRFAKRVGFTLLEWVVLGILWALWFVVIIWHAVRNTVVGVFSWTRWILWA